MNAPVRLGDTKIRDYDSELRRQIESRAGGVRIGGSMAAVQATSAGSFTSSGAS